MFFFFVLKFKFNSFIKWKRNTPNKPFMKNLKNDTYFIYKE